MKSIKLTSFWFIILTFWLSSCTTKSTLVSLPDFSTAYSITIIYNWSGLSPAAPMNSLYILENPENFIDKDYFQGSALFSVGGYWNDTKKETAPINVPKDIIQSFLQKLSQARPENGEYKPSITVTDDYPEITIRVIYGKGELIEFHTASQGDEHIPWLVTYNGKPYVINSGIPMQALEILKPYLAQEVFDNLINQQMK